MRRTLLASILLVAGCAGSPPAPEAVRLGLAPAAGRVFVRQYDERIEGFLIARLGVREERYPLEKDERRTMDDEILASDGRQVNALRRKLFVWDLKRQVPGDIRLVDVPVALRGRTIVLKRTEFGTDVEGAEGAPADELRANSLESLEALLSLPDRDVRPGDSWPVDGDRVVRLFGGEGSRGIKVREAQGTATLLDRTGRQAVVSLSLTVEGALRALLDVDVHMKLEATFRLDVEDQIVLTLDAGAVGKLSGEVVRDGRTSVYDGAFKLSAKGTSRPR